MASSSDNSNLMTDLEEAYQEAVSTLTQEDTLFDRNPETLQQELDAKILKLTDTARNRMSSLFSER